MLPDFIGTWEVLEVKLIVPIGLQFTPDKPFDKTWYDIFLPVSRMNQLEKLH